MNKYYKSLNLSWLWTSLAMMLMGTFALNAQCTVDCSQVNYNLNGVDFLGTFDGSAYYVKPAGDIQYLEAEALAESLGGSLPVINSQAENDYLASVTNGNVWLALTDANQEGNFHWTTGAALNYTNWNTNEPNNVNNEDYVQLRDNGTWNDVSINSWNWAVIEIACPCVTNSNCSNVDFTWAGSEKLKSPSNLHETLSLPNIFNSAAAVDITEVFTSDSYTNRVNIAQPNERVSLIFLRNGIVTGQSAFTDDLQDYVQTAVNAQSLGVVTLTNGADQLIVAHANSAEYGISTNGTSGSVDITGICLSVANSCDNVTSGGMINMGNNPAVNCGSYNPTALGSTSLPSGGSGAMEYMWLSSTTGCPTSLTQAINGANNASYNPGTITETTYYVRCSRRAGCTSWTEGESNCVTLVVDNDDSDGDGICNNEDCAPNDPSLPAVAGTACDDGNANTINDVITADGCGCEGTPDNGGGNNPDCTDISITTGDGTITVTGLDGAPVSSLQIFTASWQPVYSCFADCGATETVTAPAGDYLVFVKYYEANYTMICQTDGTFTVNGGGGSGENGPCENGGGDSDGDGICNNEDCAPNNPNLPAPLGSVCDDGDANTINDVIVGDGCACEGTLNNGTGNGPDCADITINSDNGVITVTGLDGAPISSVQVFTSTWSPVYSCFADCAATEVIEVPQAGDYLVFVKYYQGNYALICQEDGTFTVGGGNGGGGNTVPTATNDTATTPAATPVTVSVSNNDSYGTDGPNDGQIVIVQSPSNGTAVVGDNGTPTDPTDDLITYTPAAGFSGEDTVVYEITDSNGDTATATVTITVEAGNTGGTPDCDEDIIITAANGIITVTGLDSAPVSSVQIFTSTWAPEYSCFADCAATETIDLPAGDYLVFVKYYNADYSLICQKDGTFTIGGGGGNNGPCENAGGDSDGDGVCDNEDCAPNNPSLPAAAGTACDDGNANTINDVITADGCGCEGTPDNGGGNNPDCTDISITTGDGTITVTGLDGAPVSSVQVFTATWQPVYSCFADCAGTEIVNLAGGDYLVFVKYYQADYTLICQEDGTFTIGGGNNLPVATDDSAETEIDTSITINVTNNDDFGDDGPANSTIEILVQPTNGMVSVNDNGTPANPTDDTILYTPNAGFVGTDVFTYVIIDSTGDQSSAAVTVTVNDNNDLPIAVGDQVTLQLGETIIIPVTDNDDFGNDGPGTGSIVILITPATGTATVDNNGTPNDQSDDFIVFVSNGDFFGNDNLTYEITDGNGDVSQGFVGITTFPNPNDTPNAVADLITTDGNTPVDIDVLDNDDFGNDGPNAGQIMITQNPANGTAIVDTNGTPSDPTDDFIVYTPDNGFVGIDELVYEITDTDGDTDTGILTITVIEPACNNITDGGIINMGNNPALNCGSYNPSSLGSTTAASGGSGALEYVWLSSTTGCPNSLNQTIAGASGATYNPGTITQTTYFRRCSRRAGCTSFNFGESNCITLAITAEPDATIASTNNPGCGASNGSITFNFTDNANRTNIEFSVDGGATYPLNVSDNVGSTTFTGLGDGTYNVYVRWGDDACEVSLGTVILDDGAQAPGTSCDDGNPATTNDVILANGCDCEGTVPPPVTCAVRTVSNATTGCGTGNGERAFWANGLVSSVSGYNALYSVQNGVFTEFVDGTATFTGTFINQGNNNIRFEADLQFAGRTFNLPSNGVHSSPCYNENIADWLFYPGMTGTLTGTNAIAGGVLSVTPVGQDFQTGTGASLFDQNSLGASSWLDYTIVSQPTGSASFNNDVSMDLNWLLSGSATACGTNPNPPMLNCENRVTNGLLVLYDFTEGNGTTVNDISGNGTPLDLHIETSANTSWLPNCGLSVNSSTKIQSAVSATKVADAVKASNEVTMEVWVKPANLTQDGPARIMTISENTGARNITLGQEDDHYAMRMRTTSTTNNGLPQQNVVGTTTSLQHVVYTKNSAGHERIYVNGVLEYSGTRSGNTSNWATHCKLTIANETTNDRSWLGEIYLASMYDRDLSQAEVSLNYEAGHCCASTSAGANGTQALAAADEDILNFTAKRNANAVELNWANNTGFKNDYFVVEHSLDGVNFEAITERASATDIELNFYTATDDAPAVGENFYRVQLIFNDGTSRYTDVKSVVLNDVIDFGLYPNPASSMVNINLAAVAGQDVEIRTIDQLGRTVSVEFTQATATPHTLNVVDLRSGRYMVMVIAEGKKPVAKQLVIMND